MCTSLRYIFARPLMDSQFLSLIALCLNGRCKTVASVKTEMGGFYKSRVLLSFSSKRAVTKLTSGSHETAWKVLHLESTLDGWRDAPLRGRLCTMWKLWISIKIITLPLAGLQLADYLEVSTFRTAPEVLLSHRSLSHMGTHGVTPDPPNLYNILL